MSRPRPLLTLVVALWASAAVAGEPLSRDALLDLVESNVDASLILRLVERDCVAFEVNATTLSELAPLVPTAILDAALTCERDTGTLLSPATPPGVNPEVEQIALSDEPALSLHSVRRLLVVPFVADGVRDEAFTATFKEQLRAQRRARFDLIDELAVSLEWEETGAFHSNAPLKSLLSAARKVGADALVLGVANYYRTGFGDPQARLDVKIVEVNQGHVLWQDGSTGPLGGGWSRQNVRKGASKKVVKKLP